MSIRSFPAYFILAFICLFILGSCQDHRDTSIDTFGEIDSSLVAADTTMQVNMDRSYEYQKTLVENDTVVYDFLAYDKPKGSSSPDWESKFIVIRRTKYNQDTIVKDSRAGIIQNAFLADLNGQGKPAIFFYEYPKHDAKPPLKVVLFVSETDGRKKVPAIATDFKIDDLHYRGRDSFFVSQNYLTRRIPYYEKQSDSIPSASLWQSYKLSAGKLILEKEKKVVQ